MYPVALSLDEDLDRNAVEREALVEELREDVVNAYDEREEELGDELMRALERYILLQIIDERWREHLHDMDYLREGIHLRGFAQIEPIVAYKNDGFEMFTGLINSIWEEFARYIFHVEVEVEGQNGGGRAAWRRCGGGADVGHRQRLVSYDGRPRRQTSRARCGRRGGRRPVPAAIAEAAEDAAEATLLPQPVETRRLDEEEQIGRNDPCWCGSRQEVQEVPWRLAPVASATS